MADAVQGDGSERAKARRHPRCGMWARPCGRRRGSLHTHHAYAYTRRQRPHGASTHAQPRPSVLHLGDLARGAGHRVQAIELLEEGGGAAARHVACKVGAHARIHFKDAQAAGRAHLQTHHRSPRRQGACTPRWRRVRRACMSGKAAWRMRGDAQRGTRPGAERARAL